MMRLRSSCLLFPFLVLAGQVLAAASALDDLKPFLKKHCYGCHGPEKQKGDFRFDTLEDDLSEVETLETWQGILDQLNLGEMPPKKKEQPTQGELIPVVDSLTATLSGFYARKRSTGGRTVLRRLNRHELRNTLRDLLHLDGADYRPDAAGSRLTDNNGNGSVERTGTDPLRFFPEDEAEEGFFNIGDELVMSDFLLKLTLGAVEETLAQATHLEPTPAITIHDFDGPLIEGKGRNVIANVSRERNPDFELLPVGYERYGRISPTDLRGGVGLSARYRITVEASGHNQKHPWSDMLTVDEADPFQLCLNMADTKNGGIAGVTSTPLALWSLPKDGTKKTFTYEGWMDRAWTPWVGWENGPTEKILRPEKVVEKFLPSKFRPRPDKKTNKEAHENWPTEMAEALFKSREYSGPHLRIHRLKVEPLIDTWPPLSHSALYGSGSGEEAEVRKLMTAFAERAFRRPVEPAAVEPYIQLVLQQQVDPVVNLSGGIKNLRYRIYEGKWSNLPDFDALKPVARGVLPKGLLDIRVAKRDDYYGVVFEGSLEAPKDGEYVFEMASDDGARILVDGVEVVKHDGLHGPSLKKGNVALKAGEHAIRVEYVAYGLPNSFRAGWRGKNSAHVQLSPDSLHSAPKKDSESRMPPFIRAMQDGYAAILCSPQFLYLKETPGRLDDFALASRLSYFLWSSMPDEDLLALARAGKLSNPAELDRQVERMLDDPKAGAFNRHFPSAWLRLDKLGKMPPSGGDFQFYKNLKVEPMLMKQVTTYFTEVLESNGKIEQFIDSDYTYMNQTLAKWIYRREGIRGERLRKVALNDPRRGGIFTQPGVMTATANGVDTSPVIRGVWVLENILGTPPAPPPPDVEPLPTDTREATTIRGLLELHRKNEACNSCHRKIDPMGFAFENFDVVGRWRDRYKRAKGPIDTKTTLSNGTEITDIVEFKKMLKERKPLVVRCLTEKMLTYATGRKLEAMDRGAVNRITTELARKGEGLRDLVHLVVRSDVFLGN